MQTVCLGGLNHIRNSCIAHMDCSKEKEVQTLDQFEPRLIEGMD